MTMGRYIIKENLISSRSGKIANVTIAEQKRRVGWINGNNAMKVFCSRKAPTMRLNLMINL